MVFHFPHRMVRQVALVPAGCQPWHHDVVAAQGNKFAYAATLAIYVYEVSNGHSFDYNLAFLFLCISCEPTLPAFEVFYLFFFFLNTQFKFKTILLLNYSCSVLKAEIENLHFICSIEYFRFVVNYKPISK